LASWPCGVSDSTLYFNPGAAGHRRFSLPVTVGRLIVQLEGLLQAETVELETADWTAFS
jgi:hypothetical protein